MRICRDSGNIMITPINPPLVVEVVNHGPGLGHAWREVGNGLKLVVELKSGLFILANLECLRSRSVYVDGHTETQPAMATVTR